MSQQKTQKMVLFRVMQHADASPVVDESARADGRKFHQTPVDLLAIIDNYSSQKSLVLESLVIFYEKCEETESLLRRMKTEISQRYKKIKIHQISWRRDQLSAENYKFSDVLLTAMKNIRLKYPESNLVFLTNYMENPFGLYLIASILRFGVIGKPYRVLDADINHSKHKVILRTIDIEKDFASEINQFEDQLRSDAIKKMTSCDPNDFKSDFLKQAFCSAGQMAKAGDVILITGEKGSGKFSMAGWIHNLYCTINTHMDRNMIPVKCYDMTEEKIRQALSAVNNDRIISDNDNRRVIRRLYGKTILFRGIENIPKDIQKILANALINQNRTNDYKKKILLIGTSRLSEEEMKHRLIPEFFNLFGVNVIHLFALRTIKKDIMTLWKKVFNYKLFQSGLTIPKEQITKISKSSAISKYLRNDPLKENLYDLIKFAEMLIKRLPDRNNNLDTVIRESIESCLLLPVCEKEETPKMDEEIVPARYRVPETKMQLGAKHCLKNRIRNVEIQSVYEALKAANNNQDKAAELLSISNLTMRMQKLKLKPKRQKKNTQGNKKTKK